MKNGRRQECVRGRAPGLALLALLVLPGLSAAGSAAPATSNGQATVAVEPGLTEEPGRLGALIDHYLERYFDFYPTRATSAGRHDRDAELENFSVARRAEWAAFQRRTESSLEALVDDPALAPQELLDAGLLLRQVRRQRLTFERLRRPERDPLFWSRTLASATTFLLVRNDVPAKLRLQSAAARALHIPRLAAQAGRALSATDPALLAPELLRAAAGQLLAAEGFYRERFAATAGPDLSVGERMEAAGRIAADALAELAEVLDALADGATGDFRLGERYAESFATVTGREDGVAAVLARARAALEAKRHETVGFGRTVWAEVLPREQPPSDDRELVRRLFARIGDDHAESVEEFVDDYRALTAASVAFIREHDVMTLPEPLTLTIDRSPAYMLGQAVGGVYSAGPYASAESNTLLFLPTPPSDAPPEAARAFFRDFNHHFNVMITPHEVIPGHYAQLKHAARHPSKVRALFGDGVYIEGWGTFCERLMLDLGWGDSKAYLAHLKKQLENIARTIVDIEVHTGGMTEADVLRFTGEEAFQEEQFGRNMWRRTMTTSPQLTFYFLGYEEVAGLYSDWRQRRAEAPLKQFMDAMMEDGPVPLAHYRSRLLDGS